MSYWRLHYHAVWACKDRQPLITAKLEPQLYQYILGKAHELNAIMHGIGGTEDHLHIIFSLAPKYAISDFIGKIKGASSHWVTYILKHPDLFDWQRGFGIVSFGGRHFQNVIHYVRNQKQHHQKNATNRIFEKWSDEDDGVIAIWDDEVGDIGN